MDKVLVLASGGLDSSVLVALYHSLGYDVHALYIDYNNKNKDIEYIKVMKLLRKLNIHESNLFTTTIYLPWSKGNCIKGKSGDSSYVEMRNMIFLSLAVSCAEAKGISKVGIGCIDAFEYSDTSKEFLSNFSITTDASIGIKIEALLKNLTKQKVYELGMKLGIVLEDTHSCNIEEKPCGKCQDCKDVNSLIASYIVKPL